MSQEKQKPRAKKEPKEYSPWRATWLALVDKTFVQFYGPGNITIAAKPQGRKVLR